MGDSDIVIIVEENEPEFVLESKAPKRKRVSVKDNRAKKLELFNSQLSKGIPLRPCRHHITLPYVMTLGSWSQVTLNKEDFNSATTALKSLLQKSGLQTKGIDGFRDLEGFVNLCTGDKPKMQWLKLQTLREKFVDGVFTKKKKTAQPKKKTKIVKEPASSTPLQPVSQSRECKICYENEVTTCNIPCGHAVACSSCVLTHNLAASACAICRQRITYIQKLFI